MKEGDKGEGDRPAGGAVDPADEAEGLWDDLPETVIEVGDDDDALFSDLQDVEVYKGLSAEEDIAVETEAVAGDEDVVVEAEPEVEVGGPEEGLLEEVEAWSTEEWAECARIMAEDARAISASDRAARLLAAAGRVHEVRLDKPEQADKLYRAALELDRRCLSALQGMRRMLMVRGDAAAARVALRDEREIATDEVVRRRIDGLDYEISSWTDGAGARGDVPPASGGGDPYPDLVKLCSALAEGRAGDASRALLAVAQRADDGLFVSSLASAAGLLAEVAGDGRAAAAAHRAALEARESDEVARLALWRWSILDRAWMEAEKISAPHGPAPGTPAAVGHGFLRAAQSVIAMGRSEESREMLAVLPSSLPEKLLGVLSARGGDVDRAMMEMEDALPEGGLRAALGWGRRIGDDSEQAGEGLRRILELAPHLDVVRLDLIRRLAGKESAGRAAALHALVDDVGGLPGSGWLVGEAAVTLLENGRNDDAIALLEKALPAQSSPALLWAVVLKLLASGDSAKAVDLAGKLAGLVTDPDLRLALDLMTAVLVEFDLGDPERAASILSGAHPMGIGRCVMLTEAALGSGPGGQDAGYESLTASLEGEEGPACVPAVLATLGAGMIDDPEARIGLLRRVLEVDPDHLFAFARLRGELLAAGLAEEYGRELDAWMISHPASTTARMDGERMALLSLGAGSSLEEGDLVAHLERSRGDAFLPLFLAGLQGFAGIAAVSAEKIASGLEGRSADRWWYEAARRWSRVDFQRMLSALTRISDGAMSRAADGLVESACWIHGRWDEIAGRLIERMKALPEGERSEDVLARMAYVDGFLKGERSMALAEAESLLDIPSVRNLFCLRFLYTAMLEQGRLGEAARPAEAMARILAGSDESSAFAWLAARALRADPAGEGRTEGIIRAALAARAQDLPLLLVTESIARTRGDIDLLASVVSELAGAFEEDREQGSLLWVAAILYSERDPERAFSLAREAAEKLPTNPLAALLVEQMAASREDWATAAMFARQAASTTRQLAFGVEDYLRAGAVYRDKLHEDGWAVQCFEQAISLDPSDPRGFDALREHFMSQGSWDRVATLIEERILAMEDEATRHVLLRELALVYEQAGRKEEAIASLRRVLAVEPEDPECLEILAKLCIRSSLWDEAVSALQERAMLPMSPEQSVDVFRTLGGLYVDQVPDDRKAQVCFERVLAQGETDLDVVRQLAMLYERTGGWEKGLRMAEILYNAAEDDAEKVRWLVAAGRLWQTGGGDLRRAEQSFEVARKLLPGAADPIVALVRLYRHQGDQRALSFHVGRSLGDIQLFAKEDPGNLSLYHTVYRIAVETEVARNVRIAGTLLEGIFDLGVDEQAAFGNAGGRLAWRPGPWLADPAMDEILVPRSFTPSFRLLVARLRDVLLKSVGYDPARYGISRSTRLAKRAGGDVALVEEMARHFEVKPLQVHLTDLIPNCLTVLPDSPPLLVIGEPLYGTLTDGQKRFAFAWGCKLSQAGLVPFASMTGAGCPALWVALIQQFEPSYFVSGVPANDAASLGASLRHNFPAKAREDLFGPALECAGDQNIVVSGLHADITSYADAAALLACGDIAGALQFVWSVTTMEEPFRSDFAAARALRESPALARLVEFIISGRLSRCLPAEV